MASRSPYPIDHATHSPVLISLAKHFTIRGVFEFGAGVYSTALFLDRKFFPKVDAVISVEPHQEWRDKVIEKIGGADSRLTFIDEVPNSFRPGMCDLILIDNGPEQHKIETIKAMSAIAPKCPDTIFVVHDAEHAPYFGEITRFPYFQVFDKLNPETAVCSARSLSVEGWLASEVEGW